MKAGNITGYWPPCADETARTHGYRPVSECEAAIAAGAAGPCHSGECGLVDYGIVEVQNSDEIVSVNDKHALIEMRELMLLEDTVFMSPVTCTCGKATSPSCRAPTTQSTVYADRKSTLKTPRSSRILLSDPCARTSTAVTSSSKSTTAPNMPSH